MITRRVQKTKGVAITFIEAVQYINRIGKDFIKEGISYYTAKVTRLMMTNAVETARSDYVERSCQLDKGKFSLQSQSQAAVMRFGFLFQHRHIYSNVKLISVCQRA